MVRKVVLALLISASSTLFAQNTPSFELSVDSIMRGPQLVGYEPQSVRWSADNRKVYFSWKTYSDPIRKDFDTWVVNADGTGLRRLSKDEALHAPPSSGRETRDRKRIVFTRDGDVYLFDSAVGKSRQLTKTTDSESSARFTHDEKSVTFVRANNLFRISLSSGEIEQLTDIVAASDKSARVEMWNEKKETKSQEYLRAEERKLLKTIDERARKREEDEADAKRKNPRKPHKLDAGQEVADLELTPDGRFVLASFTTEADKAKSTMIPNFITETAYTTPINGRKKVGDALPVSKLASINVTSGEVKWLQHGLKAAKRESESTQKTESENKSATETKTATTPPEQRATEQAQVTETREGEEKASDRDIEIDDLVWSEDGKRAVLVLRSIDNKDKWLLSFDPATAVAKPLVNIHDDAWVGYIGSQSLGFLADNQTVYYIAETSGFAHLYTIAHGGGTPRPLTSGEWEVVDAELADDKKTFILRTSEESPFERHLYQLPVAGGQRKRLTRLPGDHDGVVSPNGQLLADLYSYSNKPPELFIGRLGDDRGAKKITDSPAPEFWNYPWLDVPIVRIKARDGAMVPARIYKPANWQKGGPAVMFVHGAGYLQNVHRWWSSYFREYMFHHLLMERGYLVLDIDYRASSGYGRDWRTGIYRHMGGKDLTDHLDAAQWLVREQGADPQRLGIYGGSYGGFITLMAMFTSPDTFAAGAALRPVTDWAHYNHPYTSNILNAPQDDPEAYRRSSPIYFAEGLKGSLLLLHGMVDVNVHFQDSVRLAQRLIELRKENWELAGYPVEDHSFVEATSWADEYKRILKLFERELK